MHNNFYTYIFFIMGVLNFFCFGMESEKQGYSYEDIVIPRDQLSTFLQVCPTLAHCCEDSVQDSEEVTLSVPSFVGNATRMFYPYFAQLATTDPSKKEEIFQSFCSNELTETSSLISHLQTLDWLDCEEFLNFVKSYYGRQIENSSLDEFFVSHHHAIDQLPETLKLPLEENVLANSTYQDALLQAFEVSCMPYNSSPADSHGMRIPFLSGPVERKKNIGLFSKDDHGNLRMNPITKFGIKIHNIQQQEEQRNASFIKKFFSSPKLISYCMSWYEKNNFIVATMFDTKNQPRTSVVVDIRTDECLLSMPYLEGRKSDIDELNFGLVCSEGSLLYFHNLADGSKKELAKFDQNITRLLIDKGTAFIGFNNRLAKLVDTKTGRCLINTTLLPIDNVSRTFFKTIGDDHWRLAIIKRIINGSKQQSYIYDIKKKEIKWTNKFSIEENSYLFADQIVQHQYFNNKAKMLEQLHQKDLSEITDVSVAIDEKKHLAAIALSYVNTSDKQEGCLGVFDFFGNEPHLLTQCVGLDVHSKLSNLEFVNNEDTFTLYVRSRKRYRFNLTPLLQFRNQLKSLPAAQKKLLDTWYNDENKSLEDIVAPYGAMGRELLVQLPEEIKDLLPRIKRSGK